MGQVRNKGSHGNFAISLELLAEATEEELDLLFKGIVIYRADTDISAGVIIYRGTSKKFRRVEFNESVPWYRFVVSGEGHDLKVDVHEVKEPSFGLILPYAYGHGVVYIPDGLMLVDVETGEIVAEAPRKNEKSD